MKIVDKVCVYGLKESIIASKYPMAVDVEKCSDKITPTVINLATAEAGSGHDNFLNGIIVQFNLTLPLKVWTEAQRYHWLDFVSSQSTMHRITAFNIEDQCNDYVSQTIIDELNRLVAAYKAEPTAERYLDVLYNIPTGFCLTARMTTNYRQLKTIYRQRKDHRLPEWREFCRWIETLPCSQFITGEKK